MAVTLALFAISRSPPIVCLGLSAGKFSHDETTAATSITDMFHRSASASSQRMSSSKDTDVGFEYVEENMGDNEGEKRAEKKEESKKGTIESLFTAVEEKQQAMSDTVDGSLPFSDVSYPTVSLLNVSPNRTSGSDNAFNNTQREKNRKSIVSFFSNARNKNGSTPNVSIGSNGTSLKKKENPATVTSFIKRKQLGLLNKTVGTENSGQAKQQKDLDCVSLNKCYEGDDGVVEFIEVNDNVPTTCMHQDSLSKLTDQRAQENILNADRVLSQFSPHSNTTDCSYVPDTCLHFQSSVPGDDAHTYTTENSGNLENAGDSVQNTGIEIKPENSASASDILDTDMVMDCNNATDCMLTGSTISSDNYCAKCEKCGKDIPVWEMPEHLDFHFALDLQRDLNPRVKVTPVATATAGKLVSAQTSGKRKQSTGNSKSKKVKLGACQEKIDSFFTK